MSREKDPSRKIYELVQEGYSLGEIADGMQMTISGVTEAIEKHKKTLPIIKELRKKGKEIRGLVWDDDFQLKEALLKVLGEKGVQKLKQAKYSPEMLSKDLEVSLAEARKALRREVENEIILTTSDADSYFRNKGEVITAVEFRVLQVLMDRLADDPDSFTNTQLMKFHKQLGEATKAPGGKKGKLTGMMSGDLQIELGKFRNAVKVNGKMVEVESVDANKEV